MALLQDMLSPSALKMMEDMKRTEPIIRAKENPTDTINIYATDKKTLIGEINKKIHWKSSIVYLSAQRECGCIYNWNTPDDVPEKNVICPHGNKIIIYSNK